MSTKAPHAPEEQSTEQLAIGVIGCGGIGSHHAERLPDGALAAGLDVSVDAREYFADAYDVPVYADPERLYADVDAVIVATPNRYHEPYAVDALERGIHVLLEKPLAHNLESAERIAHTAAHSDACCMVGFNNRFSSAVGDVLTRIDRGEFGHVTHVHVDFVRKQGAPDGWFQNPDISGGGVLIDLGVHALDLGFHLLGSRGVGQVTGSAHDVCDTPVDDAAHVAVETDDGRTMSATAAWDSSVDSTEVDVYGSEKVETFSFYDTDVDTHAAEQRAFIDAIEAGYDGNVADGLTVQSVIDKVYRDGVSTRAFYAPGKLLSDGGDE